jgi:hypothetical protein
VHTANLPVDKGGFGFFFFDTFGNKRRHASAVYAATMTDKCTIASSISWRVVDE